MKVCGPSSPPPPSALPPSLTPIPLQPPCQTPCFLLHMERPVPMHLHSAFHMVHRTECKNAIEPGHITVANNSRHRGVFPSLPLCTVHPDIIQANYAERARALSDSR